MKTVQYSSQRRGTPNLHLLSHPLTLRRCNLSNESNCIVCRDAPLEFLNLPWCPSPVTGIAVVPSLTQTFPRQELQCPMTNEIRPLIMYLSLSCSCSLSSNTEFHLCLLLSQSHRLPYLSTLPHLNHVFHIPHSSQDITESQIYRISLDSHQIDDKSLIQGTLSWSKDVTI